MTTSAKPKIQFLYIVSSGNADSIYKIGISDDPSRRIKEIRDTYNVPRASITDEMDVPSREEVFAIENSLHTRFASKRTNKYGGKEWFKLSAEDLTWLRGMCKEQSDSFAQATAYYGLHERASEIKRDYYKLEEKRQAQITYNRRFGKTYDTAPDGLVKEYEDLSAKISGGHLAKRFVLKDYDHPAKELVIETEYEIDATTKSASPNQGFIGILVGIGSAAVIGSASGVDVTGAGILSTAACGLTGLIAGEARREKIEKESLSDLRNIFKQRYGADCLDEKLFAILDKEDRKSYLVRDFQETTAKPRNKPALLPQVSFEDKPQFLAKVRAKNYFNPIPLVIAGLLSLGIIGGYAGEELKLQEERQAKVDFVVPSNNTTIL